MAFCIVGASLPQLLVLSVLILLTDVGDCARTRSGTRWTTRRSRFPTNTQYANRNCCERNSKRIIAGFDSRRLPVYLDVGHCKKICGRHHGSNTRAVHSCPRHHMCRATRTKVETVHLYGGSFTYDVIKDCRCSRQPRRCQRKPLKKVFYPDTPYEREVDVGQCIGHCRKSKGTICNAVKNKTVTVKGPNGATCVNVIKDCNCGAPCFRAQRLQIYYEGHINESTMKVEKKLKEIDVGECIGSCNTQKDKLKCVLKNRPRGACLMSLTKRKTSCVPIGYKEHNFVNTELKKKTVLEITKCSCK